MKKKAMNINFLLVNVFSAFMVLFQEGKMYQRGVIILVKLLW